MLRRSPTGSRPPSPFALVWTGRFYDIWQRRAGAPPPLEHLPLGDSVNPAGLAACSDVRRLATEAGPAGRLATVFRPAISATALSTFSHPSAWGAPSATYLLPKSAGTATGLVDATGPGRYDIWLGGSFRARLEVAVDGRPVGALSNELNNTGAYTRFGSVDLTPGMHQVELRYAGPGLAPGTAGPAYPLGPLVLATTTAPDLVSYVSSADARALCGKSLDWIEALPPA